MSGDVNYVIWKQLENLNRMCRLLVAFRTWWIKLRNKIQVLRNTFSYFLVVVHQAIFEDYRHFLGGGTGIKKKNIWPHSMLVYVINLVINRRWSRLTTDWLICDRLTKSFSRSFSNHFLFFVVRLEMSKCPFQIMERWILRHQI